MPLVPFPELMAEAESGGYAVGYFEPWDLQSLLAVLQGAEDARSPVMVGQSGIFLPTMLRGEMRHFPAFAHAGRIACENCRVPVSYLFNETPRWDWAIASLDMGFNVTMYSNPDDDPETHVLRTAELVRRAAQVGVAVQSELGSLESDGELAQTGPEEAADFVRRTGVDALGVVAGNRHVFTGTFELDVELVGRLAEAAGVPLVLHGGSGARDDNLRDGIARGIRQVNYGSAQRRAFLACLRDSMNRGWDPDDMHLLLGTGLEQDLMRPGLEAVSALVAEKCVVLGSSGKA